MADDKPDNAEQHPEGDSPRSEGTDQPTPAAEGAGDKPAEAAPGSEGDKPAEAASAPESDDDKPAEAASVPEGDDDKPAEAAPKTDAPAGDPPAAEKPAAAAAEKPAAAPPAAEEEEPEPEPEPNPVVVALQAQFPGVEQEGEDTAGGPIVRTGADDLIDVMTWLRDNDATDFKYLASLTVVDWTERQPRFDVVYNLYSIGHNHWLTVKVGCADGDGVASVAEIWGTANWHEREAYDLYGVEFLGHPELERIFLPEDWEGFPLRKDYPLEGPNLELLTRQQAAFRGGRFDRIRGDYEMTEKERELTSAGIAGALWTPKPPEPEAPASEETGEPTEG